MTSSTQPTTGEFLYIGKFDKEISSYLDANQHYSKIIIKEDDKPPIVEALRIWLIKYVGCFEIRGDHFPTVNLDYWFDHETLVEQFDELLLTFRDWLNTSHAITTTNDYSLLRYMRSDTFICFSGMPPEELIPPPLYVEDDYLDHDVQEVIGHIEQFEQLLNDKLSCNFDVGKFFKEMFPEDQLPEIIKRYLI